MNLHETAFRGKNAIECSRCNKNAKVADNEQFNSFARFQIKWGYGSRYDTEIHEFALCEDCYYFMLTTIGVRLVVREEL